LAEPSLPGQTKIKGSAMLATKAPREKTKKKKKKKEKARKHVVPTASKPTTAVMNMSVTTRRPMVFFLGRRKL
jgi:hypothetical protein